MRRAGLAVVGAAAAAPIVGSASARAAGTTPAYTDAPNTFTENQTVLAQLAVGTATPQAPLHVRRDGPGSAVRVYAEEMALDLQHTKDWQGEVHDLVNLRHQSTGDGIFIVHQGGKPPGFTGQAGGNAGVNVLVPYFIDDDATGRGGNVVNANTGMKGLHIETQAVVDSSHAIDIQHFSNAYAMYMKVQPEGYGQPVGNGGAIYVDDFSPRSTVYVNRSPVGGGTPSTAALQIDDSSAVSTIRVEKKTALGSTSEAMLNLIGRPASPIDAITVRDANYYSRLRVGTDGLFRTYDSAGQNRVEIASDGRMALGGHINFNVQYQGWMDVSGIARNLALVNQNPSPGSGTSIEFDDSGVQFARLRALYENRSAGARAGALSFEVRSSDNLTERLRLNGTGIGFFGVTPVDRQVVVGSRKTNGDALANLLAALARLGLITNNTSA